MTSQNDGFDPEDYIRTVSPTLGLTVAADHMPGVSTFLSIAKGMADTLDAAPVPDRSLELASVFDAGQALKAPPEEGK